jgi:hypothetical protein
MMKRLADIARTDFPLVLLKYSTHILGAFIWPIFTVIDYKEARFESICEV